MGVTSTIRYFAKDFPDRPLKEIMVGTWKKQYELHLKARSLSEKSTNSAKEIMGPSVKRRHPFLLGVSIG